MAAISKLPLASWARIAASVRLYRSSQAVSVVGQKVYIFGGELVPREPVDNRIDIVNIGQDQEYGVQTLPAPATAPTPRVGTPSTTINQDLYLFSGRGGVDMKPVEENGAIWSYEVSNAQWSLIEPADSSSPFPSGRSYHCITSDGSNSIYVQSGCPEAGRLSDLWKFDLTNKTWTELAPAPGPARGGASIAFSNGKLYRVNGFDGKTEQGGSVDVFDIAAGSWSTISYKPDGINGPEPRSVSTLLPVTVQGKVYLVAMFGERDPSTLGHAGAGKMLSDAWAFDVQEGVWQKVETESEVPNARGWFDADVAKDEAGNDIIVVHGGLGEDNQRLGDVWRLSDEDKPATLQRILADRSVESRQKTSASVCRASDSARLHADQHRNESTYCHENIPLFAEAESKNRFMEASAIEDHQNHPESDAPITHETLTTSFYHIIMTSFCPALVNDVQELFRRVQDLESTLSRTDSPHQSSSRATLGSLASTPLPDQGDLVPDTTPPSISAHSIPESQPPSLSSPTAHSQPNQPFRDLGCVSHYLGQNWYHKGIPILSERGRQWLLWRTGQHVSFERFHLFGSASSPNPGTLTQHTVQELCQLPDRHVVESILDIYFRSAFRLVYPILDRVLIEETLKIAYERRDDSLSSRSQLSAMTCILAALSLSSRFKGSEAIPSSVKIDEYAAKAQSLLGHVSGEINLEVLQTVLMLQVYRTSTGEWETATTLHAIACRMVCSLGGHFRQPAKPYDPSIFSTERRSQHTRTLFWLSYVFDKDISLRSGQPPLLIEDYCDLTPPDNYTMRYNPLTTPGQDMGNDGTTYEGLVPYFQGDLGLGRVKEQACLLLYSPKAFNLDDCQLLLHIRHLDNELENWRSSIPSDYRPKLAIQPGCPLFPPEMNMPQRMRCAHLQLEYHYVMTAIHTAVRRCGKAYAKVTDLPDDLHSVFHSSSDLALEASRSTLSLLKNHLKESEDGTFW
ncbi:Nitrile-specifier 5 [Fusarium albosuccineum]|uniref:Nitrile-specifier 5 n=1 Tax=Fusarium albosuccineum TaxID=1237068 RepID=A0A8H4KX10_9HYPO|nr:Nitrile-specifier 5 [Fusarium albosuccineum]